MLEDILGYVHALTSVGLEAQATAYSNGEDGIIKYLALLPQECTHGGVVSRDDGPTDVDVMQRLHELEPGKTDREFIPRCWIRTHPCFKALMSTTDLLQLSAFAWHDPNSFGIVLSPRLEGVKALCVHLTRFGLEMIKAYQTEPLDAHESRRDRVSTRIFDSTLKYYCQIPFVISFESCVVIDLRNGEDVVSQINAELARGNVSNQW